MQWDISKGLLIRITAKHNFTTPFVSLMGMVVKLI
jgi:hypothetical protein